MSLGHGSMQRAILEAVHRAPAPMYRGSLMWELWGARADASGDVTDAFYKSFSRAWNLLAPSDDGPGEMNVEERELVDVDEVVRFYPDKTQSAEVRRSRRALLRVLLNDVAYRQRPAFKSSTLDRNVVGYDRWEKLSKTERKRIHALEKTLLAAASQGHVAALLEVVVAFRSVLGRSRNLEYLGSLHAAVAAAKPHLDEATRAELDDVVAALMPEDQRLRWTLKDRLYGVVSFHKHSTPSLHLNAKQDLLAAAREIVERLPGHRGGDDEDESWIVISPEAWSPVLDKLLDRHVLGPFEFASSR